MDPSFFVALHPDGSTTTVDRRRRSAAHTTRDVLAVLALTGSSMPPVMRRTTGGLTMVWRDPRDVSFEPLNPVVWHTFGQAARGPVAVLGSDKVLTAFCAADRDLSLPSRLM
jgi:hypothetical protein